jgi:hypothetical protein
LAVRASISGRPIIANNGGVALNKDRWHAAKRPKVEASPLRVKGLLFGAVFRHIGDLCRENQE